MVQVDVGNTLSASLCDNQVAMPIVSTVSPLDLLSTPFSTKLSSSHLNSDINTATISPSAICETPLLTSMNERAPFNESLDEANGSLSPPTSPTASSSPPPPMPVEPPSTAFTVFATGPPTLDDVTDPSSSCDFHGENGEPDTSNELHATHLKTMMDIGKEQVSVDADLKEWKSNVGDTMDEQAPSSPLIPKQDGKELNGHTHVAKTSLTVEVIPPKDTFMEVEPSDNSSFPTTTLHSLDEPKESCTVELSTETQDRPSYLYDETESSSCYSADSSGESENEHRAAVKEWQKNRSRVAWRWGWLQLQVQEMKRKVDECDTLLGKRAAETLDHLQVDSGPASKKLKRRHSQEIPKSFPPKHPFFSGKGMRAMIEKMSQRNVDAEATPTSSPAMSKKKGALRRQKSLQINIPHSPYSLKSSTPTRTCQKSLRSSSRDIETPGTCSPATPKLKDITTPEWRVVQDYDSIPLPLVVAEPNTDDEVELEVKVPLDEIPEDYFDIRDLSSQCEDSSLCLSTSMNSISPRESLDGSLTIDDSSSEDTSDEAFAERHFCRELLERKRFYFPEKKELPASPNCLPTEFFITDEAFPLSNKKKPINDPEELKEEKLKVKFLGIRGRYLGSPRFSRNWKRRKDLADWHSPTASQKALALSELLASPNTCMVNPEDWCGEDDEVQENHLSEEEEEDSFVFAEDSNDALDEERPHRQRPRGKGRTHEGIGKGRGKVGRKKQVEPTLDKFAWEIVKRELEPEKASRNIIVLRRVPKFPTE